MPKIQKTNGVTDADHFDSLIVAALRAAPNLRITLRTDPAQLVLALDFPDDDAAARVAWPLIHAFEEYNRHGG